VLVLVIVLAFLPFSPTTFKIEDEHEHDNEQDLGEDEDEHREDGSPFGMIRGGGISWSSVSWSWMILTKVLPDDWAGTGRPSFRMLSAWLPGPALFV
jgi:hypothetical protein